MDTKEKFENAAKSFSDMLNAINEKMNNESAMSLSEIAEAIASSFGISEEPKNKKSDACEKIFCKKSEDNENSSYSACSFSMAIGNEGVHVYRMNDNFFINDKKVSKEAYNEAMDIFNNSGAMNAKITSIKDILNAEVENASNTNRRIKELEENIKKAQAEIEDLRKGL